MMAVRHPLRGSIPRQLGLSSYVMLRLAPGLWQWQPRWQPRSSQNLLRWSSLTRLVWNSPFTLRYPSEDPSLPRECRLDRSEWSRRTTPCVLSSSRQARERQSLSWYYYCFNRRFVLRGIPSWHCDICRGIIVHSHSKPCRFHSRKPETCEDSSGWALRAVAQVTQIRQFCRSC